MYFYNFFIPIDSFFVNLSALIVAWRRFYIQKDSENFFLRGIFWILKIERISILSNCLKINKSNFNAVIRKIL